MIQVPLWDIYCQTPGRAFNDEALSDMAQAIQDTGGNLFPLVLVQLPHNQSPEAPHQYFLLAGAFEFHALVRLRTQFGVDMPANCFVLALKTRQQQQSAAFQLSRLGVTAPCNPLCFSPELTGGPARLQKGTV